MNETREEMPRSPKTRASAPRVASDRHGSLGNRFSDDVFGYSKAAFTAKFAHQSLGFQGPALQAQAREKPDGSSFDRWAFTACTEGINYQDIITIKPGKRGGRSCIRGMRIMAYDVLSNLTSGMTRQEILADFPYPTEEQILACLSWAADRERHLMLVKGRCFSSAKTLHPS